MFFLETCRCGRTPEHALVLEQLCVKHDVPMDVLEDLVGIQRERSGEERARNVYPRIEETLSRMD
jgi:hypothetical protein